MEAPCAAGQEGSTGRPEGPRPLQPGEEEVLHQQTGDDARRRRAERNAHGHVAPPARGAREQKIGHVCAADQQHTGGRAEEEDEGTVARADHFVFQRHHRDANSRVGCRVKGRELLSNPLHLALCRSNIAVGLDAADDFQEVAVAAGQELRREPEGNPILRLAVRIVEARWHHTNDRVRFSVHPDRFADEVPITGERSRPQPIAEDDRPYFRSLFVRSKGAPDEWRYAKHGNEICRDSLSEDLFRRPRVREVRGHGSVCRKILEGQAAAPPVEEGSGRNTRFGNAKG